MTFQVGEKVVYPNHGVGTIENISSRSFGTQQERFLSASSFPQLHDCDGAVFPCGRCRPAQSDQSAAR